MIGSGIPEAQHILGLKYTEGVGVEKDYELAIEWYEKAVKNGFAGSANNLGTLHEKGTGVEKNFEKAFYYYKLASQWGDTQAMQNLANLYFSAKGTGSIIPSEDDIAEGMKWLRIASEKGNLVAERFLESREKMTENEVKVDTMKNLLFPKLPPEANPLDQEQYGKAVRVRL
uniref:Sel1 repeat family protein n=1 Tax=Panagrolaimus sp. ES5 TaxID=591445 RepID=A0AC34FX24_9BILA